MSHKSLNTSSNLKLFEIYVTRSEGENNICLPALLSHTHTHCSFIRWNSASEWVETHTSPHSGSQLGPDVPLRQSNCGILLFC